MRIAVTGAAGFIGSYLCRHLSGAGHKIVGLVRETSNWSAIQPYCERLTYGDHADESVFHELLDGVDCVVHNSVDWSTLKGGYHQRGGLRQHYLGNLVGSLRLLEVSAPRQFIFVSTVGVHHDILPQWNNRPDETHPLRPASTYGAYKAAVEAHLWAETFGRDRNCSAVRPAAVYGIDPKLDRSIGFPIVRQLVTERRFDKSGGGKFVHVDDVCAAVGALIGNAEAAGQAYHLADCYARWSDWAEMAADILKIRPEITVSSPPEPRNQFDKAKTQSLGVQLDRGHAGIRTALEELIAEMAKQGLTKD